MAPKKLLTELQKKRNHLAACRKYRAKKKIQQLEENKKETTEKCTGIHIAQDLCPIPLRNLPLAITGLFNVQIDRTLWFNATIWSDKVIKSIKYKISHPNWIPSEKWTLGWENACWVIDEAWFYVSKSPAVIHIMLNQAREFVQENKRFDLLTEEALLYLQ